MAEIFTPLIDEDIDNRYFRTHADFGGWSDVLQCYFCIRAGFVYDKESTPVIKGTSNRGGLVHDYFCRKNSIPVVTKKQAADVYLEVMTSRDKELGETLSREVAGIPKKTIKHWTALVSEKAKKTNLFCRRWVKYWFVRAAWGYFHKHTVEATYEEMSGNKTKTQEGTNG